MGLSNELLSQFAKVAVNKTQTKKESSTVYATVVDSGHVKLDGSDIITPVSSTVTLNEGNRVIVMIKNHNAVVTGNLTDSSASSAVVDGKADASEVDKKITELDIAIATRVTTEQLNAEKANITKELTAADAVIKNELTASMATIESTLSAKDVEIEGNLLAANAEITNLKTNKLDVESASATYATIVNLEATNTEVNNLKATHATFENATANNFEAVNASIEELEANQITTDQLDAKYATIDDLEVEKGRITDLEAEVGRITDLEAETGRIEKLIFGSATGDTIQTSFANAVIAQLGDAQIKSAMIENISASKITSGDVITNNVRVRSEDGSLLISDETMQISDTNRVRVQIGKDASGDYSINIWDDSGNLMFSKGGITDSAIKDAIIRNDMVSDTANIAAHKLDIDSLFEEINDSSKTIKSTKIYLDDEGQTLDVTFKELTTDVTELGETVSSHGTAISVIQGQINSKVWEQDITTAKDELETQTDTLSTQYSELNQEVDEISATVANHSSEISKKADSSTVTTVNDKVTSLEANLSGFQTTVSDTYATKTSVENIEIGGRNLVAGTSKDTVYTGNKGESQYKDVWTARTIDIPTGEEYIVSFDAKADEEMSISCFFYDPNTTTSAESSTGSIKSGLDGHCPVWVTTEWKRYWVKWTQTAADKKKAIIVGRNNTASNLYIRAVKFEAGNKASAWTPAPEDIEDRVSSAETKITQNSDSITSVANRTTTVENKFNDYSTTEQMNSAIEQKASSIISSVGSNYATKDELSTTRTELNSVIDQRANSITSSVSSSINNIKVGGQNLLLNTGGNKLVVMKGGANYSRSSTVTSVDNQNGVMTINASTTNLEVYYRFMTPTESSGNLYGLKTGEDYIFSGKAQVITTSGTLQTFDTRTQMYGGAGWHGDQRTVITTTDTTDWVDFVAPIHVEESAFGAYISVQLYYETGGWTGTIKLKELKLERGTRVTDWSPAPEDVKSDISTAQSTANGAQSSANKAQTDIDNLAIGGRNLLLNSKTLFGSNINGSGSNLEETYNDFVVRYKDFSAETSGTTDMLQFINIYPEKYGDDYTLSFYAKGSGSLNTYFYGGTGYVPIVKCVQSTGAERTSSDGSTNWTLTDTWTRYWVVWTLGETGDLNIGKHVLFRLNNGGIANICGFKLEKGNRVSDWTPAPEDMSTVEETAMAQETANKAQETANNVDEKVVEARTLIQQLSDSISTLVTDGSGTSLMTQTEDGWTFSTANIQSSINSTSEALSELQNGLGNTNNTVGLLQQAVDDLGILSEYVKITTYEDEPCIELGDADSDFKLLITNTRIMFKEGSATPAYITNQSLHIKKAVIEEEMQQGGFVWKARSNGNLGLIWKGGNS